MAESPKSYEQTGHGFFFFFLPSCVTLVTSLCWFPPCIRQLDSFQKRSILCLPHLHTSCLILMATVFWKDVFSRQSMNDKLRWPWSNRIVDPRRRERHIFHVLHSTWIEWEAAICKLNGEPTRANHLNYIICVFATKYTYIPNNSCVVDPGYSTLWWKSYSVAQSQSSILLNESCSLWLNIYKV